MAILNFGFFANRERGRREKKLKIKNHDPNEEKVLDYQGSAQVQHSPTIPIVAPVKYVSN